MLVCGVSRVCLSAVRCKAPCRHGSCGACQEKLNPRFRFLEHLEHLDCAFGVGVVTLAARRGREPRAATRSHRAPTTPAALAHTQEFSLPVGQITSSECARRVVICSSLSSLQPMLRRRLWRMSHQLLGIAQAIPLSALATVNALELNAIAPMAFSGTTVAIGIASAPSCSHAATARIPPTKSIAAGVGPATGTVCRSMFTRRWIARARHAQRGTKTRAPAIRAPPLSAMNS